MSHALIGTMLLAAAFPREIASSPREDLEAKVVFVDVKNNFIVISKGKKDGLGSEFDYEIVRQAAGGKTTVGSASFEKYIGQETMCKLTVDAKTAADVKVDDTVICHRKV